MTRAPRLLASALLLLGHVASLRAAAPPPRPADGVYGVLRDGLTTKEVLPLKASEVIVVHRHRYLKKDDEPPRFVVVRRAPDVALDLDGDPEAMKDGAEVVGIRLKLRPGAAKALERLTSDGGQVVIVLGGEVVTMHKVREPIKGGHVQITSCAPKAAPYLLEQLRSLRKGK